MNKNYIAGFFDADGYITICKNSKKQEPIPTIGFTNNVKSILEEIQNFIYSKTNLKGSISLKKARCENHNDSYDLKYRGFNSCIKLIKLIPIIHPKKYKRCKLIAKIHSYTPRNGKYSPEILEKRRELCEEFLHII